MSSPFAGLVNRGAAVPSGPDSPAPEPVPPSPKQAATAPESRPAFWAEFIRVQFDKILLFSLIVFLHHVHADDRLQAAAIGGLIYSLQTQRFKWTVSG